MRSDSDVVRVWIDGASSGNPGPAGCGVVIEAEGQEKRVQAYIGKATNNVAEYTALLIALEELRPYEGKDVIILSDSELLVRQINGEYQTKNPVIKKLKSLAENRLKRFQSVSIQHIGRADNSVADSLAKRAIKIALLIE